MPSTFLGCSSLKAGRLIQRPAASLPYDAGDPTVAGECLKAGSYKVDNLNGHRSWQLRLEADAERTTGPWGVRIGSDASHVDITLDEQVLRVDRSTSRYTQHGSMRAVTLPEGCEPVLEIIHDRSLTEVFVGDGALVLTLRSFVDINSSGTRLMVEGSLALTTGSTRTFMPS